MDDRVQLLFVELAGLTESGRFARLAGLAGVILEEVRMEVESLLRFDAAAGASTSGCASYAVGHALTVDGGVTVV